MSKTVRVKFLTSVAAAEGCYVNGDVAELSGTHVDTWLKAGICRAVGKNEELARATDYPQGLGTARAIERPEGFDENKDTSPEAQEAKDKKNKRKK